MTRNGVCFTILNFELLQNLFSSNINGKQCKLFISLLSKWNFFSFLAFEAKFFEKTLYNILGCRAKILPKEMTSQNQNDVMSRNGKENVGSTKTDKETNHVAQMKSCNQNRPEPSRLWKLICQEDLMVYQSEWMTY